MAPLRGVSMIDWRQEPIDLRTSWRIASARLVPP